MTASIPSITRPWTDLAEHYDVLVIGSGYGGAVAACRLAGLQKPDGTPVSVALFERGREHRPGEFPATGLEAAAEFQVNLEGVQLGREDALYDFHAGPDISVFKGCGLGGTSLVNANVALDPDPRVFEDPAWPAALRADLDEGVARGYRAALDMLRPRPYPDTCPEPAKLASLAHTAGALGAPFSRPPINVHFGPSGPNHVGVHQEPCSGCGDCVSGCNVGAKNTLLMNYLPEAARLGAAIFTSVRVMSLAPGAAGGWQVRYRRLDVGREAFAAPEEFVGASVVILAGGTLGSTEILLRSQAALGLSPRLGERFTGNGDILAFGYDLDGVVDGIGMGVEAVDPDRPVGPCITGLVDCRRPDLPLEQGFVVEEGSIPGALAPYMASFFNAARDLGGTAAPGARSHLAHTTESFLFGPRHGAVNHTQTYLVMAHDGAGGRLQLSGDALAVAWPDVGRLRAVAEPNRCLDTATLQAGGVFVRDPIWTRALGRRLVTVHPLGGCPMGEDASQGVVNHKGQVFRGAAAEVYSDLYVCDGSVMPRSLGVNPLLTITALAERNVALLAAERGWRADPAAAARTPNATPARLGILFTEMMTGSITLVAGGASSACSFVLTIESDDLEALLTQSGHPARINGTVDAPLLSPEPLEVVAGEFALFIDDPTAVDTKVMRYQLTLRTRAGRTFQFLGQKFIREHGGFTVWTDTTTLFVDIREPGAAVVLARGVLRIPVADFVKQLGTLKVLNASSTEERLVALEKFGRYFAGTLYESYGGILVKYPSLSDRAPTQAPQLRRARPLRAPQPAIHLVTTDDGKVLRLTRFQGGSRGPVLLIHGLGVSSRIFSIDTIDTNLVEALCVQGFDVWLLDYRASIALPLSSGQFSGDDVAAFDHPAAVREVLSRSGAASLQVVAHCFGANTFFMSLMRGIEGVRSVVFSQVGAHLVAPLPNELRAGLHLPGFLDRLGVKSLTAVAPREQRWQERLFDLAGALNPTVLFGEHCRSTTCHRISFMYAPLFEHANLNEATHDALEEMFGVANIEAFEHLALMVRAGRIVERNGADTYLGNPGRALAALADSNLRVLFLHGALNQCYRPAGTEKDVALLGAHLPPERVRRVVIEGYGHIDCIFGKNAARDVFPAIVEELYLNPTP